MKNNKIKILTLSYLLGLGTLINTKAQVCDEYIMFKKGATFEMETFDAKGNKLAKNVNVVKEVTDKGGQKEALIHSSQFSKKDKLENEGTVTFICLGDKIKFDLSSAIQQAQSMLGENKNIEVKMENSFIEIPHVLTVGQSLPDSKIVIKMIDKSSGADMMTSTVTTLNIKVVGKESVTTPAGTFDSFKITYDNKIEMKMAMNNMTLPPQMVKGLYYISKGVGMVKTGMLDENGELKTYTVLTKISK